jgi:hypothetical protein
LKKEVTLLNDESEGIVVEEVLGAGTLILPTLYELEDACENNENNKHKNGGNDDVLDMGTRINDHFNAPLVLIRVRRTYE